MDYGLLAGLGEGLQKGVAAYMEGRKLKRQEEKDAREEALQVLKEKLLLKQADQKDLEEAFKSIEAFGALPPGTSEKIKRHWGLLPQEDFKPFDVEADKAAKLAEHDAFVSSDREKKRKDFESQRDLRSSFGLVDQDEFKYQAPEFKYEPPKETTTAAGQGLGLLKVPGVIGKQAASANAAIDRANTTLIPQGFIAKQREDGSGFEVAVLPENEKQRLLRERHEADLKAKNLDLTKTEAEIERLRAQTAKTKSGGGGQKLAPELQKQINEMSGSVGKQRVAFSQIDELLKQTSNPAMPEGDRINIAREQLKLLNSTLGADAVGAEEVGRLASWLEYGFSPSIGKYDPRPNIDKFNKQLESSKVRIGGTINTITGQIGEMKRGGSGLVDVSTQKQMAPQQTPPPKTIPKGSAPPGYVIMLKPDGKQTYVHEKRVNEKKQQGYTPVGGK